MAIDRLLPSPDGHAAGFGSDAALIPGFVVAHIARDPLDPAFSDRASSTRWPSAAPASSGRCSTQNLISGIGNIYADETFLRSPTTTTAADGHAQQARARARWLEVRLVLGRTLPRAERA
jgi:formamidopyrimidine-DNA glycosylase